MKVALQEVSVKITQQLLYGEVAHSKFLYTSHAMHVLQIGCRTTFGRSRILLALHDSAIGCIRAIIVHLMNVFVRAFESHLEGRPSTRLRERVFDNVSDKDGDGGAKALPSGRASGGPHSYAAQLSSMASSALVGSPLLRLSIRGPTSCKNAK